MNTIKGLVVLLKCLPEILRLIETMQKRIDEKKLENKIHEDLNKINDAFEKQDANELRKIFNS